MADYRLPSNIEAMLRTAATDARDSVGRCVSAGVTLVDAGEVTGRGCTDAVARELDMAQSQAGEGPCLDALRFLQIFNVASIADAEDWPLFRDKAIANGIRSSLSIPMCGGRHAMGTLNLYSRALNGFEGCEGPAMQFAAVTAATLLESGVPKGRGRKVRLENHAR